MRPSGKFHLRTQVSPYARPDVRHRRNRAPAPGPDGRAPAPPHGSAPARAITSPLLRASPRPIPHPGTQYTGYSTKERTAFTRRSLRPRSRRRTAVLAIKTAHTRTGALLTAIPPSPARTGDKEHNHAGKPRPLSTDVHNATRPSHPSLHRPDRKANPLLTAGIHREKHEGLGTGLMSSHPGNLLEGQDRIPRHLVPDISETLAKIRSDM